MNVLVTDWERITRELNVEVNQFPLTADRQSVGGENV